MALATAPAPPLGNVSARTSTGRLIGIDVARAIAFAGMLLAHFAIAGPDDPGWLQALDAAADGRAAPLFCVLLGVGAGILVSRGTPDRIILIRGALLAAVGLLVWPISGPVYLILPHYGLMLMAVPLLRRIPTALLLPAAAVAFLIPTAIVAVLDDHGMRSGFQPQTYREIYDAPEVIGNVFWWGGYPVVGWVGFVLVGLWVARLQLHRRAVAAALLVGGVAVAALQPLVAWLADADAIGGIGDRDAAGGWAAVFDGVAHSNRFAWYVLASATAVAAIGACLLLASVVPRIILWPLAALGQLALTAYLAHLFIGNEWVWPWVGGAPPPSLAAQMVVVAVVVAVFAVAATLWRLRFQRGPIESVLRAAAH